MRRLVLLASLVAGPLWQPVCIRAGTPRRDDLRGTPADELISGLAAPTRSRAEAG